MIGGAWARFRTRPAAMAGLCVLLALIVLSLLAPAVAPQNPSDPLGFNPLDANRPPGVSWALLLGADARGRSVLALLLWGGRVSLAIGAGAALLAAVLGVVLGALGCWHGGTLDPVLSRLMEVCQAAPPLVVLLVLAGHLGGVSAPLMLLVFALTGWVAPARLTRAAMWAGLTAPYVEAARAVGVTGLRLVAVHLLPGALPAVAAWVAAGAATFVALEAGLDFLGLGLSPATASWGTALVGAQDALAAGNWWWMTCGGLALAAATLALGAVARGIARALDPTVAVARSTQSQVHAAVEAADSPAAREGLGEMWRTPRPEPRPESRLLSGRATVVLVTVALLVAGSVGVEARRLDAHPSVEAGVLLRQAVAYPLRQGQRFAYIATATYTATEAALRGRSIPWAAWGSCPPGWRAARCATSDVQLWYSAGQARAQTEGLIFVCTPHVTWGMNPMAGLAQTQRRGCSPLGPEMGGLGATADLVRTLLPGLQARRARVLGQDAVAGRRCWVVALTASGRACLDADTGLTLRLEQLDRAGAPLARFVVDEISYGLDLAPQIFANPIPGGHGPLLAGLTEPLLDIQEADDLALFTALVPTVLPAGLSAQAPTLDSFYDDTRGYALEQRVRQAYQDRSGRVAFVLIETLPGSAWDATPPRAARQITVGDRSLVAWEGGRGQPAIVRVEVDGTAALVSSRMLPLAALEHVAVGLR